MFELPIWAIIGLCAQALWVIGSLIDKYLIETYFRDDDGEEEGVGTLVLFSSFFAALLSLFAWFYAGESITFTLDTAFFGICVGVLNGLWVLMYLYAIEDTEISRTVPLFQTIPIFGFIFGYLLLHETLTYQQALGAIIVIIGAFILSYHFKTKSFHTKSFALMIGASVVVALQETLFKFVAVDTTFWTSAFWMGIGLVCFGLTLFLFVEKFRSQFISFADELNYRIWSANAVNEIIDNAANLLFAYAIILGPIALVQSVNAYQPLLTLIVAYVTATFFNNYLNEDTSKKSMLQKVIGVIVITTGSILIYWTHS